VGLEMDSWQEPGKFQAAESKLPASRACGLLSPLFTPSLDVAPDGSTEIAPNTFQAGAPAGYEVHLAVPQSASSQPLATPDLRDATITLPAGTVASPSAANG